MGLGISDAEKRIRLHGTSEEEQVALQRWKMHGSEKAVVSTVRLYPSTKERLKKFEEQKNYIAVPGYELLDVIINAGIEALGE